MIAEIGFFALILALLFAFLLTIIPPLGIYWQKPQWQTSAAYYVILQSICVVLSYVCLMICFLQDDFTVSYVLTNSSKSLPLIYKWCAVWGGHEGSMLLWVLILSTWMLLVTRFSRSLDKDMRIRVLSVLGGVSFGFILFLIVTSNPFVRQFSVLDTTGRDLNPLLQDLGFLFHPPMLYMGYVGFVVAFAYAIAALTMGYVKTTWAKWTRPWTLAAWCCLTLGITLGSWWAYRELGWGGYWFWDPVENASFMPWLVGTALIHSLMVSEQRQQFVAWTMLLSLCAFSLSLVGTFLVRSGVLTSVHAFAVDPARGLYILLFLLVIIGGSLVLFAVRAQTVISQQAFSWVSKESALLFNNVLLMVLMLTILMGTIYPLIMDGLHLGKLSVGAPYFNTVFVPLSMPLFVLMGLGIHCQWQHDSLWSLCKRLRVWIIMSVCVPWICIKSLGFEVHCLAWMGAGVACWIVCATLKLLYTRIKRDGFAKLRVATLGMAVAHCGVAVSVLGVAMSHEYGAQQDVALSPGMSTQFSGLTVTFAKEQAIVGSNYHGTRASIVVKQDGQTIVIYPEKRIYDVSQMVMTESAIDVSPFRDIYVALGEPLDDKTWSVRLYYKPLIRWIWGGGILLFLGGVIALLDPRYYIKRQNRKIAYENRKF